MSQTHRENVSEFTGKRTGRVKFRHSPNPSFVRLYSSLSSFRRRTPTGMSHDLYVSEERFLNLPSVRRFINRPTFREADTSTRNVGHFCALIVEFEGTDLYLWLVPSKMRLRIFF